MRPEERETPMTAQTHSGQTHRHRHANRMEYAFYFILILLISVPTALVRSVFADPGAEGKRFFLAEAWAMAQRVTPQIFSA